VACPTCLGSFTNGWSAVTSGLSSTTSRPAPCIQSSLRANASARPLHSLRGRLVDQMSRLLPARWLEPIQVMDYGQPSPASRSSVASNGSCQRGVASRPTSTGLSNWQPKVVHDGQLFQHFLSTFLGAGWQVRRSLPKFGASTGWTAMSRRDPAVIGAENASLQFPRYVGV
jgi:hypothetical protein